MASEEVNMDSGSEDEVKKLKQMLVEKDEQLKMIVNNKEQEIQELRSQLDKYKSVLMSFKSDGFLSSPVTIQTFRPRKNRLLGISAEPQELLSFHDLLQTKFTEYPKSQQ